MTAPRPLPDFTAGPASAAIGARLAAALADDAPAEGRGPHRHVCPHGGRPVTYAHTDPACRAPAACSHAWCHPR